MRVTFLGHSGFFLELPEADLLFDYYKGELPSPDPERPLFVFVSHAHADHFTRKIFSLADKTERIRFILSDDQELSRLSMGLHSLSPFPFRLSYVHRKGSLHVRSQQERSPFSCCRQTYALSGE